VPLAVKLVNSGLSAAQVAESADRSAREEALQSQTVIWTRVLGVATIVLAMVTLGLWTATRVMAVDARKNSADTLHHLKTSAELQLRAYVNAESVVVHVPAFDRTASETQYLCADVNCVNAGATPAHDVRMGVSLHYEKPSAAVAVESAGSGGAPRGVLGPRMSTKASAQIALSATQMEQIESGIPFALFIRGAVSYRDAFGGNPTTRFQYEALVSRLTSIIAIATSDSGNEAN
jgi:hypothetical protein